MRVVSLILVALLLMVGTSHSMVATTDLAGKLFDQDSQVRQEAAKQLGRLGNEAKGARPMLVEALRDADPHVVRWSAWALSRMDRRRDESIDALFIPVGEVEANTTIDLLASGEGERLFHEWVAFSRMSVIVGYNDWMEIVAVLRNFGDLGLEDFVLGFYFFDHQDELLHLEIVSLSQFIREQQFRHSPVFPSERNALYSRRSFRVPYSEIALVVVAARGITWKNNGE